MDYDETEIATTYDKARALAPETLRLWQDLLSAHIDRAAISLVIAQGREPQRNVSPSVEFTESCPLRPKRPCRFSLIDGVCPEVFCLTC